MRDMQTTNVKLLKDLARRLRLMGSKAETYALLSKARGLDDVFALAATRFQHGYKELIENLESIDVESCDPRWIASLAWVKVLQASNEDELAESLRLLNFANKHIPMTIGNVKYHKLEVEYQILFGDLEFARSNIRNNPLLSDLYFNYLYIDTLNPSLNQVETQAKEWLRGFNAPFIDAQCAELSPKKTSRNLFDSLDTVDLPRIGEDGPLVSVIMTSYDPEPEAFKTAYKSILKQTWSNFELIIVDDASPNRNEKFLKSVEAEDPRIRLVLLEQNGGTYRARNEGIKIARGEYITGQDSDDWSHPQRIERQIRFMEEHPKSVGVMVSAIRTDDNLIRVLPGQSPNRKCEVSFLTKLNTVKAVGGYLDARKAADSEFRQRIEYYHGAKTEILKDPLYLIRLVSTSLSRGDFRTGWSHPSRRAFWGSATRWHETSDPTNLQLAGTTHSPPIQIPNRFKVKAQDHYNFDILLINDWRSLGENQRGALDEINLLTDSGYRIAIMQAESITSPASGHRIHNVFQDLVNESKITHVTEDNSIYAHLVIVHDPIIMQFPSNYQYRINTRQAFLIADTPYRSVDGTAWRYDPVTATANLSSIVGSHVTWLSHDQLILEQLLIDYKEAIDIAPSILPVVVSDNQTRPPLRSEDRLKITRVGRSASNEEYEWPVEEHIEMAWPSTGAVDTRVLGDARGALRSTNKSSYSENWVVFRDGEIENQAFLRSIDVFALFTDPNWAISYSRSALEAFIAGKPVLLGENFQHVHRRTAKYLDLNDSFINYGELASQEGIDSEQRRVFLESIVDDESYLKIIDSFINKHGNK